MLRKRILLLTLCMVMTVLSFSGCILRPKDEKEPAVKEGSFPFRIVFSQDGEIITIEDVVVCKFAGLSERGGHWNVRIRQWENILQSTGATRMYKLILREDREKSLFYRRLEPDTQILGTLSLYFGDAEYYMDEPLSFFFLKKDKPGFCYTELISTDPFRSNRMMLTEAQLKKYFNIEILEMSFSEPIQNSFD